VIRKRAASAAAGDKTWDLTVWLEHKQRHPGRADIVIEATGQLIGTFTKLTRS
jgi:hypothetical protein